MSKHVEFHRAAAVSARKTARDLFAAGLYDRTTAAYKQGFAFDALANDHDLAALGCMIFTNCPDCHVKGSAS